MKKLYALLCSLFILGLIHAQIPNAGFENWSGGLPVGWWGVNSPDTLFVQSSDAHSGSSALRMNVAGGGITYGGYLFSGDSADIFFQSAPLPAPSMAGILAILWTAGICLLLIQPYIQASMRL